jgi:aryl-alcohol dehydrogenase-like predicted oxidoreductase
MTLRKRPLGRSGIEVSEIGLGAWQLGEEGWNGPGEEESFAIVDEALRLGCTFIDTAPAYGGNKSEEYLGRALEGRRSEVVICTKFGHWGDGSPPDFSADRIEESVERSLRRLRTDYLDVLLIHSPAIDVMDGTKVRHYEVLQRLVDSGVIRSYGVSDAEGSVEELRYIVETTGSTAAEIRFNALYQRQLELFPMAAEAGVGIIVKVPLESGWLTGKYDANTVFTDEARQRWSAQEIARRGELVAEFGALLPDGVSLTNGALRHILAQPAVSSVIPGVKSLAQLRENVAAADGTLPTETLEAISDLGKQQAVLSW